MCDCRILCGWKSHWAASVDPHLVGRDLTRKCYYHSDFRAYLFYHGLYWRGEVYAEPDKSMPVFAALTFTRKGAMKRVDKWLVNNEYRFADNPKIALLI